MHRCVRLSSAVEAIEDKGIAILDNLSVDVLNVRIEKTFISVERFTETLAYRIKLSDFLFLGGGTINFSHEMIRNIA